MQARVWLAWIAAPVTTKPTFPTRWSVVRSPWRDQSREGVSEAEAALSASILQPVRCPTARRWRVYCCVPNRWPPHGSREFEIGARRLLHADAERNLGEATRDVTAAEVLGNIDAMLYAVESIGEGGLLSVGCSSRFTGVCF